MQDVTPTTAITEQAAFIGQPKPGIRAPAIQDGEGIGANNAGFEPMPHADELRECYIYTYIL